MKQITIIDTFAFLFRSYHALPHLTSKDGHPTGVLTGFINFVNKMVKNHESDYLIFCADSSKPSFRKELYSDYKANRKETPEELKIQIPIALEWIEKMGFALVVKDGYEADDLIATIATKAKSSGVKARIVSSDKDLYQLISDDQVVIYDAVKQKEIDEKGCFEKFGVNPKNFIDFQALVGDTSDNVPGVKGVGQVTASKLINDYETLEKIYENIENLAERTQKLLLESKDNAYLSRELVTLDRNVFNDINFSDYALPNDPIANIKDELEKYSIKAILKRENIAQAEEKQVENISFIHTLIGTKEELNLIIKNIPNGSIVAFDTETDSLNVKEAKLVGFSFATDKNIGYYVPINHTYLGVPKQIDIADAKSAIDYLFANHKIIGHNLKFDLHIIDNTLGLNPKIFCDTIILAWLIDSGQKFSLDDLALNYLNHKMISFKEATKNLNSFAELDLENACKYASEDAVITYRIFEIFYDQLLQNEKELISLNNDLEIPFLYTLKSIEKCGITIDQTLFMSFKKQVDFEIAKLQDDIHKEAGENFNINSTKQLAMVLFERLGLQTQKKTKTGYSTDESVLLELKDSHPIVPLLLSYRELAKLKSTYIDPLLILAQKNSESRIFSSFSQVGTTTGRLSSSEPNLQNIPTRSELGRKIREGFVAKDGYKLIGADYSQIELRLLAHFSKDPTLIEAFRNKMDIHLETAKKLFGENAKEKRNLAKSVNFGLLYGMGSKKLADDTGLTTQEAKETITNYFSSFPTVKSYLESIKTEAKELGFVTTLLGRKRRFDFRGAKPQFVAMYEREAVNTRFQGSAADLIKIAMIRLHKRFENSSEIKMILQIHDELIFEVKNELVEEAKKIIYDEMVSVYKLAIDLDVSINVGNNWAELK